MIEINLLIRFLSRDPDLHLELWIAEGQRQVVAFLDEYEQDAFLVSRWGVLPEDLREHRGGYLS